jgi:iron(III) transport system substrate-binding protein
MRDLMKRFSLPGTLTSLRVLLLCGLLFDAHSITARAAESARQLEWEETLKSAKKEGQLVIYGDDEITHPDILAAFNRVYPYIKVITVAGKEVELRQRIVAERRGGKYLVDLYAGGPNTPRGFYIAKFLDPIGPALLLSEVTDTSKWYGGKHHYADPENKYLLMFEGSVASTSTAYNTKLVNPKEFNSYWDLLKPQWKGKILSWDPRASLPTQTLTLYYHPQAGPDFIRRFYGDAEVTLFRDRRQGTDWLANGKFPICFFCRDIEAAQKQGLPVDMLGLEHLKEAEGIGGGNSSVLILFNKAPHPYSAKVFINWYLSRQGQMVWQKLTNTKMFEPSDSMRIDIPKDDVLPKARRVEGRKYPVVGFLDPEPVQNLINEVLGESKP